MTSSRRPYGPQIDPAMFTEIERVSKSIARAVDTSGLAKFSAHYQQAHQAMFRDSDLMQTVRGFIAATDEITRTLQLATRLPAWERQVQEIRKSLPTLQIAGEAARRSEDALRVGRAAAVAAIERTLESDDFEELEREFAADDGLQELAATMTAKAEIAATTAIVPGAEVGLAPRLPDADIERIAGRVEQRLADSDRPISGAKVTRFIGVVVLCSAAALHNTDLPYADQLAILDHWLWYVLAVMSFMDGFRKS